MSESIVSSLMCLGYPFRGVSSHMFSLKEGLDIHSGVQVVITNPQGRIGEV